MPVLPEWHGNWHVYNDMRCSQVKEGDSVLYFKWAGDKMETPTGEQYVVLHNSDILCKT